ncbi:MAG: NADP-dependent oxidoreductase [Deltaproteobacteria bacterium]|nr:NADP-dependent oxidoreductase [Deltaproteobacteria bacterium]
MTHIINREIHLINRPTGLPTEDDFKLVETAVPEIIEGEILVRNSYMSVDPYMRGRMNDVESYVPPFALNQPLEGGCVGKVVQSKSDRFQEGDVVQGFLGWREYFTSKGSGLTRVDPALAPIQAYLGPLGMTGTTAYFGLLDIGRPKSGETVFVSAASGAVGSIVCQIAKIKGCYVVGSAGSGPKIGWLLTEAGVDKAINYKETKDLVAEVGKNCPNGIDVYFENVGGVHLAAALEHMNPFGRISLCGLISTYNAVRPPRWPASMIYILTKRLTMKGFIVGDFFDRYPEFQAEMGKWLQEGRIKWKETIVEGIEKAPKAFLGLFTGENIGKMIVKIGP